MLNKQGPGKIDWTDWTWNPISGCLHDCPYCYMKRMEKRFPGIMKPKFRPEYISKIQRARRLKRGDKIFVGSSGDMFGSWVLDEWIYNVLSVADYYQDITFQFLTKNPKMYDSLYLGDFKNCWFGTSVDGTKFTKNNVNILLNSISEEFEDVIKFVSFEPLIKMPDIKKYQMKQLEWIIVGANSNKGAKKPPMEWADNLIQMARDCNTAIWVKDNYGYPETIKEFPVKK